MLRSIHSLRWAALSLCASSLLAACGGGPDGAAGGGAAPAPPTTLSVSASELALQVSGNARSFTITNTGAAPALSVIYSVSPALPAGSTSLSNCSTLAPLASCTITVTPGATASATAGNTSPVPITFNVGGVNTNIVSASVHVLEFGSVYQSGYVFAFDDTTPATGSVGGKVVALADIAASPLPWSTSPNLINASSLTDGVANTQLIVAVYDGMSVPRGNYAAGACTELNAGGTGWYLPAICEMSTAAAGCTPGQPDIQSLVDNSATLPPTPAQQHWSSTESAGAPSSNALLHQFALGGGSQFDFAKGSNIQARCVRGLTL